MFEKLREYMIYIGLSIVALWLVAILYMNVNNWITWSKLENNFTEWMMKNTNKEEVVREATTIAQVLLNNILKWEKKDEAMIKWYSISQNDVLFYINWNIEDIRELWRIKDVSWLLNKWLTSNTIKLIVITSQKFIVDWYETNDAILLNKNNTIDFWDKYIQAETIYWLNNLYKWYELSWFWFWPFKKEEIEEIKEKYFDTFEMYEIWSTWWYVLLKAYWNTTGNNAVILETPTLVDNA